MALVKQTDIEAALGRSLTSSEANAFTTLNNAVQAYVENNVVGSKIEADTPATRYYDGGVQHLSIDPCTDITKVEYVGDDEISIVVLNTTDYTTEPRNKTLKQMLRHRVKFLTGINNVAVTAKFSTYADTNATAIIKQAIIDLVRLGLNLDPSVAQENIEGYSKSYTNLTTLVNSYKDYPSIKALYYLFPEV